MKKAFIRPVLDSEKKIMESAKLKNFIPTVKCLEKLALGGKFEIQLLYTTVDNKAVQQYFPLEILNSREQGLSFQIKLDEILNIGGVKYKEVTDWIKR